MFMHAGVLHILFNMLWLYWFGALFLNFFSARHLRGVYILGGICGGLLYMTAYNIFPYFRPMTEYSFMLGASASVLAIVAATAYREPDYPIRLFLFGTVRLKYLSFGSIMDFHLGLAGLEAEQGSDSVQRLVNPCSDIRAFAEAGCKPQTCQRSA